MSPRTRCKQCGVLLELPELAPGELTACGRCNTIVEMPCVPVIEEATDTTAEPNVDEESSSGPWPLRPRWIAAIIAGVFAATCLAVWVSNACLGTHTKIEKVDDITLWITRRNWDDQPVRLRATKVTGDFILENNGPVSESGKPHGKWQETIIGGGEFRQRVIWYWYGEEISEGEWHLRQK